MSENIDDKTLKQDVLIFGDGLSAQIWGKREAFKKEMGGDCYKLILQPTKQIIQKYNIKHSDMPKGFIVKYIPKEYFVNGSQDPFAGRYQFCLLNWDKKETELMKNSKPLLEQIEHLKKQVMVLKAHNIKLRSDIHMMKVRPIEYLDNAMEFLKKSKKVTGDEVINEKSRKEDAP